MKVWMYPSGVQITQRMYNHDIHTYMHAPHTIPYAKICICFNLKHIGGGLTSPTMMMAGQSHTQRPEIVFIARYGQFDLYVWIFKGGGNGGT